MTRVMAQNLPPDDEDDWRNIDFSKLEHVQLDMLSTSPTLKRWSALVGAIMLAGAILWMPNTEFYQLHGGSAWMFFGICGTATLLGVGLGRILYDWAQEAAERHAREVALRGPQAPRKPLLSPTVARWALLGGAVSLVLIVLFVLPEAQWQGSGYSGSWFLAALCAIAAGLMFGRWLTLQAAASAARPGRAVTPWVPPPWVKWVTLCVLITAGGVANFGMSLFGVSNDTSGFGLAGVGLFVGIFGAIWIARRFDELEARIHARVAAERATRDNNSRS